MRSAAPPNPMGSDGETRVGYRVIVSLSAHRRRGGLLVVIAFLLRPGRSVLVPMRSLPGLLVGSDYQVVNPPRLFAVTHDSYPAGHHTVSVSSNIRRRLKIHRSHAAQLGGSCACR